jgi:hypothetical protein
MKRYVILFSLILCAVTVNAQFSTSLKKKVVEQPTLAKLRTTSKTLSEEQISELYTAYNDEDKERTYSFSAGFGKARLDPKRDKSKISKYTKSGKVPCRLTASLYEYKIVKGKKVGKRMSGTVKFYFLDPEGKQVLKKSSSLSTMCPG